MKTDWKVRVCVSEREREREREREESVGLYDILESSAPGNALGPSFLSPIYSF